ncbi:MAG: Signal transduction histidine-protein kinase BarA [Syntrophus sp. PtaU1.Bin208]|nr:MAG: Signal transduction histidine-protein kinase BarA [Syntrophus sp. PtaU1.Bin208]
MLSSEGRENHTLGVAMISPDLKVLAINNRFREWYPALDIEAQPPCYLAFRFHQREEACRNCPVVKTLEDGQSHEAKMEVWAPDGARFFHIVSTPLISTSDGKITAVIETVDDITEQGQATEILIQDAERMESLLALNAMSDQPISGIISFAVEQSIRLTYSKIGYFAVLNHEETELTMKYWSNSAHAACRMTDKPLVYQTEKTGLWGEAVRRRKAIITNDYAAPSPCKKGTPEGHVPLVRHMNLPIFSGDRIVAVAGVGNKAADYNIGDLRQLKLLMDGLWRIVARKQTEDALLESEAKMKAITDSAQDAITMIDPEGKISYWNPAAERIFGYSRVEAIGRNLHECIAPKRYHEAHRTAFRDFQHTGCGPFVGKTLELQACKKSGQEIAVAMSLSSVRIKDQWHAVGILRDITDHKMAEETLRSTMEELAQVNNELEKAISLANEMAFESQTANIAKSQFLANMSHEIRTPMNGVIGMTGLLIDTDLSDDQRLYCQTIQSSGEALLGIINDILDFSKIEAGKIELEELDFDIRNTVEDSAALLATRAHEKHVEFTCRIEPALHTYLRGDPGRLRQILINLGSNAIKFTAHGEVAFNVAPVEEVGDQIKVRFEVRDTGIGIPKGKIGLLFNAFQQVDASTTRRYGGTGLGLVISKRLAELMGGEIGVESVEGQGTTFWFTAVFTRQPPHKGGEVSPIRADVRGVRILAVDDNATNRIILSEQLASWGMRHTEVKNAPDALSILREASKKGDPYRIVVTDMQMPGMDGEALGKAIKADPLLNDTILIMMTSMGKRGDARRLQAIGFSAYLTKPVKQSQLFDCLTTVLGRSSQPVMTGEVELVTRHTLNEAQRSKARILLVEDNPTNQKVAMHILEKLGFCADIAGDGREAIEALKKTPYDIVFMDVQMPVMDGFAATRTIREGRSRVLNPEIPIVAMTAHAMKGDRERCIGMGMSDYIPKPITPKALSEVLEKWLSHAPESQPVASAPSAVEKSREDPVIFDLKTLQDRLLGDGDLVKEICKGYLDEMPEQIRRLRQSIDRNDGTSVERMSHTMKGAAANVGAMALSGAALAMEKAGRNDQWDEMPPLMSEMERQFDILKNRMEEKLL